MESFLQCTCAGIPIVIDMGWVFGGVTSSVQGLALADVLANWFTDDPQAGLNSTFILDDIRVIDLSSSTGWYVEVPEGIAGTGIGTPLPNSANVVVTLNTTTRGRSFRGRNYWCGLNESALENPTTWTASTVTNWTTWYEDLISAASTAGFAMAVLSRVSGGVPRALGIPTDIASVQAKLPVATQRRRLT